MYTMQDSPGSNHMQFSLKMIDQQCLVSGGLPSKTPLISRTKGQQGLLETRYCNVNTHVPVPGAAVKGPLMDFLYQTTHVETKGQPC